MYFFFYFRRLIFPVTGSGTSNFWKYMNCAGRFWVWFIKWAEDWTFRDITGFCGELYPHTLSIIAHWEETLCDFGKSFVFSHAVLASFTSAEELDRIRESQNRLKPLWKQLFNSVWFCFSVARWPDHFLPWTQISLFKLLDRSCWYFS